MEEFLALHKVQLELEGVPERFWEKLFLKIKLELFDAGEVFMIQLIESDPFEDDIEAGDEAQDIEEAVMRAEVNGAAGEQTSWRVIVSSLQGIDHLDSQNVYLIDHAWTYGLDQARAQIESNPSLLSRMCKLMEIDDVSLERKQSDVIEDVLRAMWKFNQTYNLATAELGTEAAVPYWYIMDEFGSRIQHSDCPSVAMVPFCYVPTHTTFTVMWPLHSLQEGDEVTRDYLSGRKLADPLLRKLLLLPWLPDDMRHLSYDVKEDPQIFASKFAVHETLPNLEMTFPSLMPSLGVNGGGMGMVEPARKIKVFTDVEQVSQSLTDPRFMLVDSMEEADIIWTKKYLKDFKSFSEETPGKFINQFPFEMVVTVKNLLAVVARRAARGFGGGGGMGGSPIDHRTLESLPRWMPMTFNLKTELSQFVSYYQHRESRGLDNHWICKPFNLSRGLDMYVTNELNSIIRLSETGPKIACKYVTDPVLIDRGDGVGRVKFDLRFVVMVISVCPLELVVHQKFIVRVANKSFSLDHLDDYEKHFTVMNYKIGAMLKKITCEEFVEMFNAQYPTHNWADQQHQMFEMIRELFTAAVVHSPPAGIGHSPQSRAIYGVDAMLQWIDDEKGGGRVMQPILLECNFGPDNTRLIAADKDFFNDIFSTLFLFDVEGRPVTPL